MALFFSCRFSVVDLVSLVLAKYILFSHGVQFVLIDCVKSALRVSRTKKFYPSYLLNEYMFIPASKVNMERIPNNKYKFVIRTGQSEQESKQCYAMNLIYLNENPLIHIKPSLNQFQDLKLDTQSSYNSYNRLLNIKS